MEDLPASEWGKSSNANSVNILLQSYSTVQHCCVIASLLRSQLVIISEAIMVGEGHALVTIAFFAHV